MKILLCTWNDTSYAATPLSLYNRNVNSIYNLSERELYDLNNVSARFCIDCLLLFLKNTSLL